MKKPIIILLLASLVSACGSTQPVVQKPVQVSKVSLNYELVDAELRGEITQEQRRAKFTRERAECAMEANKVPLSPPSCSSPSSYSCQGLGGFLLGQCLAQNAQQNQRCDYTAFNASKRAQFNVLTSCMVSKGYFELTDEEYADYRAARKAEIETESF